VILVVTVSPEIPPVKAVRFSVEERPEVHPREVAYEPTRVLRFGYYLPGPSGKVLVRAGAVAAPGCLVGEGNAEVEVRLGEVSPPVPLSIARIKILDPACRPPTPGGEETSPDGGGVADAAAGDDPSSLDASQDRPVDAPGVPPGDTSPADAADRDGFPADRPAPPPDTRPPAPPPDTRPPAPPPDTAPPAPACLKAVQHCPGAAACCSGLRCGTTTAGQVCCGDHNAGCTRPGGEDCCGQLECVRGLCCLPAVYFCGGLEGACCDGRICGHTTAGHVCCGLTGASCTRPGGEDCCGALECRGGRCAP
jgi:hypothetical protein